MKQFLVTLHGAIIQYKPLLFGINGTIYYYSDVPPPFVVSRSGKEIDIPVIDSTLNRISFQCFIPYRDELISSSSGVITVTKNGTHSLVLL